MGRIKSSPGDSKATALEAEVWVVTVTEGRRRFMAAWRKEEVDAARPGQRDWESYYRTRSSVEFCEATPIGLTEESK